MLMLSSNYKVNDMFFYAKSAYFIILIWLLHNHLVHKPMIILSM